MVKWFGFKLHLIVDAKYELPVAWSVTPANVSDNVEGINKEHQISPIVDKRSSWKEKGTRVLKKDKNVSYDEDGSVYCYEDDGEWKTTFDGKRWI